MKKKLIGLFLVCGLLIGMVDVFRQISSYFSDMLTASSNLSTGTAGLNISDFTASTVTEQGWLVHEVDETHAFNIQYQPDDIVQVSFVVQNAGNIALNYSGSFSVVWPAVIGESGKLLLFPEASSNASIRAAVASGDLSEALWNLSVDDTHPLLTPSGTYAGIAMNLAASPMQLQAGDSQRFTYKLYFVPSEAVNQAAATLNNLPLQLAVDVAGSPVNALIQWSAADRQYANLTTIVPETNPNLTLTLLGSNPMYVAQNSTFVDPGATGTDQAGNNVTVVTTGTVNTAVYGHYTLTYTITKGSSTVSAIRDVYVTDGQAPVITPKATTVEKFIDPNLSLSALVTVTDNADLNIASRLVIITSDGYNPETPGVYSITYQVTDASGLAAVPVTISLTVFAVKDVKLMIDSTIILTTNGKVFTWGYNGDSTLGQGTNGGNYYTPTKIQSLNAVNVVSIASGYYVGFALTDTGKVYSWGWNGYSTLGQGSSSPDIANPTLISSLSDVKQISAEYYTAFALTNSGDLYSWGAPDYGVLGLGTTSYIPVPTKVTFPTSTVIKYISSSWYRGYAISTDNKLYAWGSNYYSGLINKSLSLSTLTPQDVTSSLPSTINVSQIKSIETGYDDMSLVTNDLKVYTWGYNGTGALGLGTTSVTNVPTLVSYFNSPAISIQSTDVGNYYAFYVTSTGLLYASGSNGSNQLGLAATSSKSTPTLVPLDSGILVQKAETQNTHSALISTRGYLYMTGSNAYGKLGDGTTTSSTTFKRISFPGY